MPLDNQVSIVYTTEELSDIADALTVIETIIDSKAINLTPKERQEYSKLGDETENFVDNTITYTDVKPEIIPFFIDVPELKIDIAARKAVDPILKRVSIINEKLDDTHKVVGFDLYNAVIAIYRNVRYLAQQNVPGTSVIYEDLKKQFIHVVPPTDVEPPPVSSPNNDTPVQ